ncbi:hypothetical protein EV200_101252 [Pedobacter psychrotolerans]|nr:hypothetical protein EV200_101252 [Pedobacter psychrotolerans]
MKKRSLRSLVFTFFFLVFSQVTLATPGCRFGANIYYSMTIDADGSERYDSKFYKQVDGSIDCTANANKTIQYVLLSQVTTRASSIVCRTPFGGGGAFLRGVAINFTTVYQCSLDDYIWVMVIAVGGIAFVMLRKYQLA